MCKSTTNVKLGLQLTPSAQVVTEDILSKQEPASFDHSMNSFYKIYSISIKNVCYIRHFIIEFGIERHQVIWLFLVLFFLFWITILSGDVVTWVASLFSFGISVWIFLVIAITWADNLIGRIRGMCNWVLFW